MEKETLDAIQKFDSLTTTRHMKMLKIAIPYIFAADKSSLYIFIKFAELVHTIEVFHKPTPFFPDSGHSKDKNSVDYQTLLSSLIELGDEKESQLFSQILNLVNAFSMYEMYAPLLKTITETAGANNPSDENNLSFLSSMLSPEQQELFNQFKNLI